MEIQLPLVGFRSPGADFHKILMEYCEILIEYFFKVVACDSLAIDAEPSKLCNIISLFVVSQFPCELELG